jgi:hypothetical protein
VKWTQRNGEQIDVRDMTDSHLHHALNLARRKAKEALPDFLYCSAHDEGGYEEASELCGWEMWVTDLEREVSRRKEEVTV